MQKNIIVAYDSNRLIGQFNALPWHLPNDLKHFKKITYGYPIIMGRVTFESIKKPLPGRMNIVLSRSLAYQSPCGCKVSHSLAQALTYARSQDFAKVFIIGGAQVFQEALPIADRIYLTKVHAILKGDTFFPKINLHEWKQVACVHHTADAQHQYPYSFIEYIRLRE